MPVEFACLYSPKAFISHSSSKNKNIFNKVCENICITTAGQKAQGTTKKSFKKEPYLYHSMAQGDYIAVCVATEDSKIRTCYALLETLLEEGMGLLQTNNKDGVKKLIKEKLAFFNDPNNDKIERIRSKVEDVKVQMIDNIDKILVNMQKADELVAKTDDLAENAFIMKNQSRSLKNNMFWRWILLMAVLACICLTIIIAIVIGVAVGVCSKVGCGGGSGPTPVNGTVVAFSVNLLSQQ
jgi:vesicle-associated membrane protein 7